MTVWQRAAAFWLVAMAGACWQPSLARAGPGGAAEPVAVASAAVAHVGDRVRVTGTGWGSDTTEVVRVVLCGNDALDGALDCDAGNTAEGGIRGDGSFYTAIGVLSPILPCPCVLRVTSLVTSAEIDLPITIVGAPTAPPQRHIFTRRAVSVEGVHLTGRGPWTALFGAHPHRVLVYSVTNTGTVVLHSPTTDVSWGRGSNPTGFVQPPDIGDLGVRQTKTLRITVPFNALSVGAFRVVVRVDPIGTAATGHVDATMFPWGLLVLVVLVLALVTYLLRRADRRMPVTAAGWYLDPAASAELRFWDGYAWTEFTEGEPDTRATTGLVPGPPPDPGWYADPTAANQLRLWDGSRWMDETRTHESAGAAGGR